MSAKPFLQAGGVPACTPPHALWCVVDKYNDFFNLYKAKCAGTGGPGDCANGNKKIADNGRVPLLHDFPLPPCEASVPLIRKAMLKE